jgi:hypothetical protein
MHHASQGWIMYWLVTSHFLNVFSSFIYLVGSVCFIPAVNLDTMGMFYFILGSLMIMIAVFWKFYHKFKEPGLTCRQIYYRDRSFFWVGVGIELAAILFLVGSYLYFI